MRADALRRDIGNHTRRVRRKQLDDGIGDTFVSAERASSLRRCGGRASRLASLAAPPTVTARHSRFVDRGGLSINSASLSQSSAASRACSDPNISATARMNAANSRSAICTWFSQVESKNDDVGFTGYLLLPALPQSCHKAPQSVSVWLERSRSGNFKKPRELQNSSCIFLQVEGERNFDVVKPEGWEVKPL